MVRRFEHLKDPVHIIDMVEVSRAIGNILCLYIVQGLKQRSVSRNQQGKNTV